MSPASLVELLEGEAKKKLDAIATSIAPELLLGTLVVVGTPWQSICTWPTSRRPT